MNQVLAALNINCSDMLCEFVIYSVDVLTLS